MSRLPDPAPECAAHAVARSHAAPRAAATPARRQHQRERDLERGGPSERGCGADHRQLRDWWAQRVATGTVCCARPGCGQPIHPDEPWDLGHDEQRNY